MVIHHHGNQFWTRLCIIMNYFNIKSISNNLFNFVWYFITFCSYIFMLSFKKKWHILSFYFWRFSIDPFNLGYIIIRMMMIIANKILKTFFSNKIFIWYHKFSIKIIYQKLFEKQFKGKWKPLGCTSRGCTLPQNVNQTAGRVVFISSLYYSGQYPHDTKIWLKSKCNAKCPALCRKCYKGSGKKRKRNYKIVTF